MKEYYFHWTGKMNQSYVLETHEREAIYEAICDHMGVFTPSEYTFADRLIGKSQGHKISHTLTTRRGSGPETFRIMQVTSSCFKIDGVNNWDFLAGLGYTVEPELSGLKLNFNVMKNGEKVAFLEAAGTNILKDDSKSVLGDKLTTSGLYKVSCEDADIEGVFYACFSVSRVEFY